MEIRLHEWAARETVASCNEKLVSTAVSKLRFASARLRHIKHTRRATFMPRSLGPEKGLNVIGDSRS